MEEGRRKLKVGRRWEEGGKKVEPGKRLTTQIWSAARNSSRGQDRNRCGGVSKDVERTPLRRFAGPTPTRPIFTDFYRFFRLSWETSTFKNYHPEDSKHSGSK